MSVWKELWGRLSATGEQCVYCDREIPKGGLVCEGCTAEEEKLVAQDGRAGGVLHVFRYDGIARQLIRRMKYDDMPRFASYIAQKMYEFLDAYDVNADVVTFVPVHKNRMKTRGFDQSELIASRLAVLLDLPCEKLVERVKDTKPQFSLGGKERAANMEGAFERRGNADIAGKSVLIIDDIYTSGATMAGCIECLLACGANVQPFVFCKED